MICLFFKMYIVYHIVVINKGGDYMPKQTKPLTCDVKEWLGVIKESKNSNWCKYVYKVAYNDRPAGIDVRNIQFKEDGTNMFGKGISLTDEECDTMVDILIENGYGSTTSLEKAIKNRNQIFDNDAFNDDLVIGFDK